MSKKLQSFIDLTRIKRPVGYMLLFWPCLWGLTIGYDFNNDVKLDGTYYLNCVYKLLKFAEKGFLDSNLPTLNEACKGIDLLIG